MSIVIPQQNKCFVAILESPCQSVCPSMYKILVSVKVLAGVLTHYHTIPHFDTLKIYIRGKHCEKRRNYL